MLVSMGVFGERLGAAREAVGLSQNKLAALAGVEQAIVNKVERGHLAPSSNVISKLAPVLGLPVAVLRAWALEDQLGEEEARNVARALLGTREEEGGDVKVRGTLSITPKQRMEAIEILKRTIVQDYRETKRAVLGRNMDAETAEGLAVMRVAEVVAAALTEQLAINIENLLEELIDRNVARDGTEPPDDT